MPGVAVIKVNQVTWISSIRNVFLDWFGVEFGPDNVLAFDEEGYPFIAFSEK